VPKAPKVPSNTELNNVSLSESDNSAAKTNASETNLVSRQAHQVLLTHAGMKMWVSEDLVSRDKNTARKCTLAFPIRKVRGENQFEHGFLTLGSCVQTNFIGQHQDSIVFYVHDPLAPLPGEEPKVTFGMIGDLHYGRLFGRNFAIVKLYINDAYHSF
jgi:hypothetical protein